MGCITGLYIRSSAGQKLYRPFSRGPRLRRGSHAPAAHEGRCGHSESLSRHCCRQQSPGHSAGAVASEATAPAVSTERGVDSCCRRNLITIGEPPLQFFSWSRVQRPFGLLMRTSSISIFVRMGHIPYRVYPETILYTLGPNRHPEVQWQQCMRSSTQLPRRNESRPGAKVLNDCLRKLGTIENITLAWGALLVFKSALPRVKTCTALVSSMRS